MPESGIFFVGNTMIDTLLANLERLRPPHFWSTAGLQPKGYFVLTLHRPANVDDPAAFGRLIAAVGRGGAGLAGGFPGAPANGQDPGRAARKTGRTA